VVGRAASVLEQPRALAFLALAAALTAYYFVVDSIPALPTWWDVALLACGLIPAVFLFDLLALPLARARGLLPLALALGLLAFLAELGDLKVLGNFAKLAAVTFFAFWFLNLFEELVLLVIVALIVPWVDAYSVFRGPTGQIVEKHPHVFTHLSFGFPLPGHQTARLGLPDLLFFALFLAAASRYRLRPGWTWLGMVAALGATVAIAQWTDLAGLPALPALSLGFLVPNADLIWARLPRRRAQI
jgi:hypothetical protein